MQHEQSTCINHFTFKSFHYVLYTYDTLCLPHRMAFVLNFLTLFLLFFSLTETYHIQRLLRVYLFIFLLVAVFGCFCYRLGFRFF